MEYYGNNDWRDYHLAHYGVLGMKWGVRKQRPTSGGGRSLSDFVRKKIGKAKNNKESFKSKRLRKILDKQAAKRPKSQENKARPIDDEMIKKASKKAGGSLSKVTKRVIKDYNHMDDQSFMRKYSTSKDKYFKRVTRYGDPYMRSPLARMGKFLDKVDKKRKSIMSK